VSETETRQSGCPECGRTDVSTKQDGTLRVHINGQHTHSLVRSDRCRGAGQRPVA
jgi:hypothetical protein